MAARIVLKWPVTDPYLDLPIDSTIIHFDQQMGVPTIWVETDAYPSKRERRNFTIISTGMTVPENGAHRGSYIDGAYTFHLYETTP